MNELEQVGDTHENFSELLHAIDPATLIAIVAAAAGLAAVERFEIRYRNPRVQVLTLVRPSGSKIVDCVYTAHGVDGRSMEIWLLEIELSLDLHKRRKWSLYVVAFEYELDADGQLVVFSPVPALREQIRTRLVPKMRIKPIVIEPDQIERITDYDEARRRPELTILGCLYHCHEPAPLSHRVAVFRAAAVAIVSILSLDNIRAWRYVSLVKNLVPSEVVQPGVEELRETGELDDDAYRRFTESERYGHNFQLGHKEGRAEGLAEGRAEGLVEGRAEGLRATRRMLVGVLERRGFALSRAQRERIASCESLETLERWFTAIMAAAANQSVDELLD